MLGTIEVVNASNQAKIKISGFIGIPEDWQFADESEEISTKERLRSELEKIAGIKASTINVEIDSFGGSVNHGLAIYNALQATKSKIKTTYTGWSASIATVIGMAGEERIAPDNMFLLIHEARGGGYGTSQAIKDYSEWLEEINEKVLDVYARGGGDKDKLKELMSHAGGEGKWIDAEEALSLGLITKIEQSYKAAAYSDSDLVKNNLPKMNKMEKSLKTKVLEAIGYTNDEALAQENETLRSELQEAMANVEGLTGQIEALNNQLSEANTASQQLSETIADLNAQITSNDEAARVAQEELTATVTAMDAEIESLKAQLAGGVILGGNADPDPLKGDDEQTKRDIERLRNYGK